MLRRLLFLLGLLCLSAECAILVVGARQGLALDHTAQDLKQQVHAGAAALSSLSLSRPDAQALTDADQHLQQAGAEARTLNAALDQWEWLLGPARRDPAARAELAQVRATLAAVDAGSGAAGSATQVVQTLLPAGGSGDVGLTHLGARLDAAQPALAATLLDLTNLDRALARVQSGRLGAAVRSPAQQFQKVLPTAETALRLATLAPAALGDGKSVSYLIVAQNPADLRPTGGYIGSWGVLTLRDGAPIGVDYRAYSNWEDVRDPGRYWPEQTAPFQRYEGVCCMAMQDANWYADFPTTAIALEQFAQADQAQPIAGVIAFDPALVQALLRLSGPVDVPSFGVTVTADNFIALANDFEGRGTAQVSEEERLNKTFLVEVAQRLATRLIDGNRLSLAGLQSALPALLDQKHVLLVPNDPDLAAYVHAKGWDGAVTTPAGDYALLDDLSLSDNKVDDAIARQLDDRVQLRADGGADVTLTITWQNRFPLATDPGAKTTEFRDYFRLYAPAGATLVGIEGADEVWKPFVESGHAVFSGYVVVPRGGQRMITVRYHAPAVVVATPAGPAYSLHVQKQPGTPPTEFHLTVTAPGDQAVLQTTAALDGDRAWLAPAQTSVAPTPPATLPDDRRCTALELVAGLKGPFSPERLAVPATCVVRLGG